MSGGEVGDAAMLAAVVEGRRGALAELYARHAPWLQIRLARRCADREIVAEVLQDTFVSAWRSAHRWDGRGEVAAWLWAIAIRRLVDALARRPRADLVSEPPDGVVTSAEEQVLLGVEYGDLGGALNRLSPDLRAVMQATVLDGLTTREAARLLRIPEGTVKTRMMRARAQLREALS